MRPKLLILIISFAAGLSVFTGGLSAFAGGLSAFAGRDEGPAGSADTVRDRSFFIKEARRYLDQVSANMGTDSISIAHRLPLEKKALDCSIKAGDSACLAASYRELGYDQMLLMHHEETIRLYNLSLAWFGNTYSSDLQDLYCLILLEYYRSGDYDAAIRTGLQATALGERNRDSTSIVYTYNMMALTYLNTQDYGDALKYGQKGMLLAASRKDTAYLYICVGKMATALAGLGRTAEGIALLDRVQKEFPTRDPDRITMCYYRYLNIYLDEDRPDLARPYAQYLIRQYKDPPFDDPEIFKEWYLGVGRFYLASKEYDKTLRFLALYEPQRRKLEVHAVLQAYQMMYQADSALGRYQDAFNEHLRFKTLSDSLFNERKAKQIARLNIDFETERKDKQLLLQQKQLQLQQVSLGRSQAVRDLFLYSTIALILIIGLLVSLYRLKTTRNTVLTRQKAIIDSKNRKLEQLVREKEWLLKEIHHRVKNNLQIIVGLLHSQGMYIKEGAAYEAIRDSQARVNSMVLIHQKLSGASGTLSIELRDYITDLIDYFRAGYIGQQRIEFRLTLAPLLTDVSVAVPLALILNEAITNSFKHAWPDDRKGIIQVSLETKAGETEVRITDNGIGLPPGFNLERQSSLGLNLIRGLTEDIGGDWIVDGHNGVAITIIFPNTGLTET